MSRVPHPLKHLTHLAIAAMIFVTAEVYAEPDPIWIIEPSDVLGAQEPIVVLDARESWIKVRDPNARAVKWQDFSDEGSRAGALLGPEIVAQKLEALGVRNDTPVVVFGDGAKGWGADGRIVWMLRALGHERTYWVQGGIRGLKSAGWPGNLEFSEKPGDFTASLNAELVATDADVSSAITNETTLFDTRERREYRGKTPYGESRGGHVPTSSHLHFAALFDKSGRVKSKAEVIKLIEQRGEDPDQPTIAYCTGGVRSAMFVVVLQHYGIRAKNYAESMWHWSALPEQDYPLVRP